MYDAADAYVRCGQCDSLLGKEIPRSDMLLCFDYNTTVTIGTQVLGFTNVKENIPHVGVDEIVRVVEINGRQAMIRPKQKPTALMVEMISRFS